MHLILLKCVRIFFFFKLSDCWELKTVQTLEYLSLEVVTQGEIVSEFNKSLSCNFRVSLKNNTG